MVLLALLTLFVSFLVFTELPIANRFYKKQRAILGEISGFAAKLASKPLIKLSQLYDAYLDVVNAKKEVVELRQKLSELSLENQRLREFERENQKLKTILGLSIKAGKEKIVANVIGEDIKSYYKGIIIDKGSESGILPKMAVISPKGLVGQVVEVRRGSSKIMVINDANSAVDVYVENKEIRGIIEGTGLSTLKLKYVKKNEEVEVGDKLITSGKDGIYPKGVPVGIVIDVNKKKGGIFLDITVAPFADFRVLDQVILLKNSNG